jgi:predicted amidophosphoribosyltransferase
MLGTMCLADLLLPHRCPVCREPGPALCGRCAASLPAVPALAPPPGLDACHAITAYRGDGRAVVAALKFGGSSGIVGWGAIELARRVRDGPPVEIVTWVPTTPAHRHQRGRDQAEVLARAVAGAMGLPAARLLRRLPGPPQAGRSATERRLGPPLAAARPAPRAVLVVDDVVTTGGSVSAAARALRAAGAGIVVAAAFARTPPATAHGGRGGA